MSTLKHVVVVLLTISSLSVVVAGESPKPAPAVPSAPDPVIPVELDALLGRFVALDRALARAVGDLQDGKLKRFSKSMRELVAAYQSASAAVQTAFHDSGQALAQIEHAKGVLDRMDAASTVPQINRELVCLREQLRSDLNRAMKRFTSACSETQAGRELERMQSTLGRFDQLNQLLQVQREGSKDLSLPKRDLRRTLEQLEFEVREEIRTLKVQSVTLSRLVGQAVSEMDDGLKVMSIVTELPRENLQSLQATRERLGSLIGLIRESRAATQEATSNAVRQASDEGKPLDRSAVLQRVRDLLSSRDLTSQ